MGHPRRYSKKHETPKKPWDKTRIEKERKIKEEFGLRRKREIWKAESIVRDLRRRARDLQAKPNELKEKDLLGKVNRLGIHCSKLDNVLNINTEDILARRLQTIVYRKKIANTPKQARQFIVHGHILINERKVSWPSYLVEKEDEGRITLSNALTARLSKDEEKKE